MNKLCRGCRWAKTTAWTTACLKCVQGIARIQAECKQGIVSEAEMESGASMPERACEPTRASQRAKRGVGKGNGHVPTESSESQRFTSWLRWKGFDFIHVPNEGKRSGRQGNRLKREGMSPGFPDFLIFNRPDMWKCVGVAIEMKRRKGSKTSDEQLEWIARLTKHGWITEVCKGADEAIKFMEEIYEKGKN